VKRYAKIAGQFKNGRVGEDNRVRAQFTQKIEMFFEFFNCLSKVNMSP